MSSSLQSPCVWSKGPTKTDSGSSTLSVSPLLSSPTVLTLTLTLILTLATLALGLILTLTLTLADALP